MPGSTFTLKCSSVTGGFGTISSTLIFSSQNGPGAHRRLQARCNVAELQILGGTINLLNTGNVLTGVVAITGSGAATIVDSVPLTLGTSTVLPLGPGTWYYRVRGFNYTLPTGAQQMSWSDPAKIVVAKPKFKIVGGK